MWMYLRKITLRQDSTCALVQCYVQSEFSLYKKHTVLSCCCIEYTNAALFRLISLLNSYNFSTFSKLVISTFVCKKNLKVIAQRIVKFLLDNFSNSVVIINRVPQFSPVYNGINKNSIIELEKNNPISTTATMAYTFFILFF